MRRDVDFLRELLLELETEQRSPPEPIFAPVADFARQYEKPAAEVVQSLELLAELELIDGPGAYRDDAWLFRKLTKRGLWLADAIRDPHYWRKVKEAYGGLLDP